MGISIRDERHGERGQAVIEYLLMLIIGVVIILGVLYQFNTAFQSWATNYFGDYLSCLLETGELPSIGGTGGDPSTCNSLFKPFSITDGRSLASVGASSVSDVKPPKFGGGGGVSENTGRGGGGGGRGSNGTPFTAGKDFGKNQNGNGGGAKQIDGGAGPNMRATNYGVSLDGGRVASRGNQVVKLDQRFLAAEDRERIQRKEGDRVRSPTDATNSGGTLKARVVQKKPVAGPDKDSGLTIADFIRFLIIAGIIIALVLFLGGQLLQIGKSMD